MDEGTILQIDSTIIAGLLILVTIGATVENTPNYNRFTALGSLLIIPFSISVILELKKIYKGTNELNRKSGAGWLLGGFIFLLIVMGIFFVFEFAKMELFKDISQALS